MGFPIAAELFRPSPETRRYFSRYPLQVAVLFGPSHREFAQAFHDVFPALDQLTAEHVAFFAVLDPPKAWQRAVAQRDWWQRYQATMGVCGHSHDDEVLVAELARLFGLEWHELPALVIATDLWAGSVLLSGTSAWHVVGQFQRMVAMSREWGAPSLSRVASALEETFPYPLREREAGALPRHRLGEFYDDLTPEPGALAADRRLGDIFHRRLDDANRQLASARRGRREERAHEADDRLHLDSRDYDELARDAAGRLVPAATVAMRALADWRGHEVAVGAGFDDDARVMFETSMRIGHILELDGREGDQRGGRAGHHRVDFTAGASGAWRAFELEINLSIVQAARSARGAALPSRFALFDPAMSEERARVALQGHSRSVDLNEVPLRDRTRSKSASVRHQFLSLGQARWVADALSGVASERFDAVVGRALPNGLPAPLMEAWARIQGIRNQGSHVSPLSADAYRAVLHHVTSESVMQPLLALKAQLSARVEKP